MAVIVLKDVTVSVNSVQLESKATSVTLNYEVEAVDLTSFDGTGARKSGAGLVNASAEIVFLQDFASAQTEATLYPLVGTTTTIVLKPTSSAVSATNPSYTLAGTYIASHTPIAGAVGEASQTTITATGGTLTKATS